MVPDPALADCRVAFLEGKTKSVAVAKQASCPAPSRTSPLTNYFQTLGRVSSVVKEPPSVVPRQKRARSDTSWSSPYFRNVPENEGSQDPTSHDITEEKWHPEGASFCETTPKRNPSETPSEELPSPATAECKLERTKLIRLEEGTFTLEVFGAPSPKISSGVFKLDVYSK